jgi:hypothetical protein
LPCQCRGRLGGRGAGAGANLIKLYKHYSKTIHNNSFKTGANILYNFLHFRVNEHAS